MYVTMNQKSKVSQNTTSLLVGNSFLIFPTDVRHIDLLIAIRFVLLTQYCAGDKIEKNEMGWACGAYGWGEGGV